MDHMDVDGVRWVCLFRDPNNRIQVFNNPGSDVLSISVAYGAFGIDVSAQLTRINDHNIYCGYARSLCDVGLNAVPTRDPRDLILTAVRDAIRQHRRCVTTPEKMIKAALTIADICNDVKVNEQEDET